MSSQGQCQSSREHRGLIVSPINPWNPGPGPGLCLLPQLLPWVGRLGLWPWLAGPHVSPWPTVIRRLFLTSKCCHLPPPWGSLHTSLPVLGQGSPNLLARPCLLLLTSCLLLLPFGPPKAHSDHLLQPAPNGTPDLLPQITPASPSNVCLSVTSSEKPSGTTSLCPY